MGNALILGESGVVQLGVSGVKEAPVRGAPAIVQLIGWPTVEDVRWLNPVTRQYQPWPDPTPGFVMYYWYNTTGGVYDVDPMPKDAPRAWGPFGWVYPYPPGRFPGDSGFMGGIRAVPGEKWMTLNQAGDIQDLDYAVTAWRYKNWKMNGTPGPILPGHGDLYPVRVRIYGPARGLVVNGALPEPGQPGWTAPFSAEYFELVEGEFYEMVPKYAPPFKEYDGQLFGSRSEAWFFPERTDPAQAVNFGPVPRWATWPWN